MIFRKFIFITLLIFIQITFLLPARALATTIPVGDNPRTPSIANYKVYSINQSTNNVSVINTDTNTVTATLTVGSTPVYGVVIGDKLYINNTAAGTVSVIDTLTDTISSTITLGGSLKGIVAVGNKVYVSRVSNDIVSVINTETDTVEASISVGDAPRNFAIVGTKVYVNNSTSNNISVIDSKTNTVIATIATVPNDADSVIIPAGEKVYVSTSESDGIVTVIDTETDTVTETIATGGVPGWYAFVYGTKIYMGDPDNGFYIINTLTDTLSQTVAVAGSYYSYVSNDIAYVSFYGGDLVRVVDLTTDTIVDTFTAQLGASGMGLVDEYLYIGNFIHNSVSVVNTDTIASKRPELTSFSTSSASGTLVNGDTLTLTANFGRDLLAGSTMNVMLNNGVNVTLDQVSGATLSGDYVVTSHSDTPDLAVSSIESASVTDSTNTYTRTSYSLPSSVGSFIGENSFITRNLGDTKNIEIGDYVNIDVGDNPYQMSGNINGYMYVANQGSDDVSVVEIASKNVATTISVGDEPYGLASLSVGGTTYVYVANINSDDVSVINTSTNTVVDTIDVGVKPYYVAVVGTDVYVTNGASNSVSVIDSNTNTVTDTISVGSYPRGIKAHGTDLYVANYGDPNYSGGNYISVIDSTTQAVTDTIILPVDSTGPRGVTVLGDNVYVSNYRTDSVTVIDANTNTITDTIDVGDGPRGLAGTGSTLYVENFDEGTVSIINTNTNEVTAEVEVGHSPSGISIIGTDAYISSFQDGLVRILDTTTNSMEVIVEESEPSSGSRPHAKPEPSPLPVAVPIDLPEVKDTTVVCTSLAPVLMKIGSRGLVVKALQGRLNENLFDSGIADGIFGPMTDKAVRAFQKAKSLDADGIVGPITRGALDAACSLKSL